MYGPDKMTLESITKFSRVPKQVFLAFYVIGAMYRAFIIVEYGIDPDKNAYKHYIMTTIGLNL